MNDIDMRPGSESFPEAAQNFNSYSDEFPGDALDTGAKPAVAVQETDQQVNFRNLREEVAKMQAEREYWKGQAEAFSRMPQPESTQTTQADAFSALDWEDSRDVRKAFEAIREENASLRNEMKDAFTAVNTKASRPDWNKLVTDNVPQLTGSNKLFAEMIDNCSNPYEAAYLLAELNARGSQPVPQQPPPYGNGQRAISNAQKPQTLSSVGGQGQLSAADYYASMSDEDFNKIAARNLANI